MNDNDLQDLWNKGKAGFAPVPQDSIARSLRGHANRQFLGILVFLWYGLGTLAATGALAALNLAGYWNNPVMRAVEGGLVLLSVLFAAFGIRLLGEIRRLERADESLAGRLTRLRRMFGGRLEIWNVMQALALPALVFALTSWVDNEGGVYRINRPGLFTALVVALTLFSYAVNKIGQFQVVIEIRHLLATLAAGSEEELAWFRAWRRRRVVWGLALCTAMVLLLLWGIWRSLVAAG